MVLSNKFNDKVSEASDAEYIVATHEAQAFNPFAPNVHLTGPNAAKLAGLEEGAGIGLVNRVTTGDGTRGPYGDRRDRRAREEEARARMLALAQQWDAEIVTVGGVSMTNAQAQAARRRILDNPEHYADWAKQRGLIKEGEERAFIETARRMTDLKDAERTGQLSPAQREEMQRLQESRLGRAVDQATGQEHLDKGKKLEATMDQRSHANEGVMAAAHADALFDRMTEKTEQPAKAPSASSIDDRLFASAPSLKSDFAAGLNAKGPLDRAKTEPGVTKTVPGVPDRMAAASGLDL